MGGSHSRRKGHRYEREIANFYRDCGYEARRGQQSRQGTDEADVIVPKLNFWIECGRRATGCWFYDKWVQAKGDCPEGVRPVVHVKPDHGDSLVIVSLAHWKDLLTKPRVPTAEGRSLSCQ